MVEISPGFDFSKLRHMWCINFSITQRIIKLHHLCINVLQYMNTISPSRTFSSKLEQLHIIAARVATHKYNTRCINILQHL